MPRQSFNQLWTKQRLRPDRTKIYRAGQCSLLTYERLIKDCFVWSADLYVTATKVLGVFPRVTLPDAELK